MSEFDKDMQMLTRITHYTYSFNQTQPLPMVAEPTTEYGKDENP